ncbi:hypothetical protein HDU97_002349 [Phlyctochytrium planicorne]|nr:hypothetical protein HDU97_002349 [Phlyctochytrium planicorne]
MTNLESKPCILQKPTIQTLPLELIQRIASQFRPRTLVKLQKAFGKSWIPIDFGFAVLNLRTIYHLRTDGDRIPQHHCLVSSLTVEDWHSLGPCYLAAYMVLTEKFKLPRLAPVDHIIQPLNGQTEVFRIPNETRCLLRNAFNQAFSTPYLQDRLMKTVFSSTRRLSNFPRSTCFRLLAGLDLPELLKTQITSCLRFLEKDLAVGIEARPNLEDMLKAGLGYRQIYLLEEALLNAVRNNCWESVRFLQSIVPSGRTFYAARILMMAARNGSLDLVQYVVEAFKLKVTQEAIHILIEDFSGESTQIIDFLSKLAEISPADSLKMALRKGNLSFANAVSKTASIVTDDMWGCYAIPCCVAVNRLNQKSSYWNLDSSPACVKLKNFILEQPAEYDTLVKSFTVMMNLIERDLSLKVRHMKFGILVRYLCHDLPNVTRFAMAVGAMRASSTWPASSIREILGTCMKDPAVWPVRDSFINDIVKSYPKGALKWERYLREVPEFFSGKTTRASLDLAIATKERKFRDMMDVISLSSRSWPLFSSGALEEAQAAFKSNDLYSMARCVLNPDLYHQDLAIWLSKVAPDSLSVETILLAIASTAMSEAPTAGLLQLIRDLYLLLFKIKDDESTANTLPSLNEIQDSLFTDSGLSLHSMDTIRMLKNYLNHHQLSTYISYLDETSSLELKGGDVNWTLRIAVKNNLFDLFRIVFKHISGSLCRDVAFELMQESNFALHLFQGGFMDNPSYADIFSIYNFDSRMLLDEVFAPDLDLSFVEEAWDAANNVSKQSIARSALRVLSAAKNASGTVLFKSIVDGDLGKLLELVPSTDSLSLETAFHLACYSGQTAIVEELLKHPSVNPNMDNSLSFRIACRRGYADIVEILMADGRINATACNARSLTSAVSLKDDVAFALLKVLERDPSVKSLQLHSDVIRTAELMRSNEVVHYLTLWVK